MFRAAGIALRAHLGIRIVARDSFRDVVDRILLLFCSDPLSTTRGLESLGQVSFGLPSTRVLHLTESVATSSAAYKIL